MRVIRTTHHHLRRERTGVVSLVERTVTDEPATPVTWANHCRLIAHDEQVDLLAGMDAARVVSEICRDTFGHWLPWLIGVGLEK